MISDELRSQWNEKADLMNKMDVSGYIYDHGYKHGFHDFHLGNLLMTLKRLGFIEGE